MSLWWRHNIYLWRHNGARRHARETLRIFHVGKLHPNDSCILIQESFWITIHVYLVNNFRLNRAIFLKFWNIAKISSLFYQSVRHCLRFYHCVSASPIIWKIVRFFHSFVDSCKGTICHYKDFMGRVLLWENFISPRNNLVHTLRRFFADKVQIPKWAPFAPNGTVNQIAGKSWNHRGQYWTLNPMARKPWISHPSCWIGFV